MTLHRKLARNIIAAYPDAVVMRADDGDVLDIRVPSLHPQKDGCLRFRTLKGRIRVSFCCADQAFIEDRVTKSHILEADPEGIRLPGNPEVVGVEQGTAAALALAREIAEPGSRSNRAGERPQPPAPVQPSVRHRGLTAPVLAAPAPFGSSGPSVSRGTPTAPRPSAPSEPKQKSPPSRPTPPSQADAPPRPSTPPRPAPPAAFVGQVTAQSDQQHESTPARPSIFTKARRQAGIATAMVLVLSFAIARTDMQTERRGSETEKLMPSDEQHTNSADEGRLVPDSTTMLALDAVESSAAADASSKRLDQRELVAFIETYAEAYRKADTSLLVPFYGDSVNYFDRGVVGRSIVFEDKGAYFARWPDIRVVTDSTLPSVERIVFAEDSPGVFNVEWRVLFTVSGRGRVRSGRALNRFAVAFEAGQRMIIIGESSSVTERFD